MNFKEGQVYKCTKSVESTIFKVGGVYPVVMSDGKLGILSEDKVFWTAAALRKYSLWVNFELIGGHTSKKEFDINKLTERELIEYAHLLESHLDIKEILEDFIEKHWN